MGDIATIKVRDKKLNAWVETDNYSKTVYTLLDSVEVAMINDKEKCVYFRTDTKGKYPTLEKRIKSIYKDYSFSEYCYMR